MKIAFLESAAFLENYIFYPIGMAGIAEYIKSDRYEIKLCRSGEELLKYAPDVVGLSVTSPSADLAAKFAQKCRKELNSVIIAGGPHITALNSWIDPAFDLGIIGEGEISFKEVLNHLGDIDKLLEISGVIMNINGKILHGRAPEPIRNIDSLPFSKREWAGENRYMHWLFSSRGCPYSCSFCCSAKIWHGARLYSPERTVAELKFLIKKFNLSHCSFMDDLFAPNIKRVELLKETFAPLKEITFTGMLRAENSDRKLTDAVYDLGVRYVHLGLESGSDKILKALKGGSATAEKNLQALINCHESGLNNSGTFIIGAPDEEIEDYDATYQFIKKSLESGILNNFTFTPLIPFPGTEIWEYGVRYDIIDPNNVRWRALNADIDNFEPEIYYYLSKKLTKKEFLYQVAKFKELYEWSKALPII